MIEFRKKSQEEDLMPEAIKRLKGEEVPFEVIPTKKADEVSRRNSKSLVITSFKKTEDGMYEIKVKDKELYRYTQKMLSSIFRLDITDVDKDTRTVTAEGKQLGIMLDILEVIALNPNYNLSLVYDGRI